MSPDPTASIYHVLLIGIDVYPPRYNSLSGCVNDIDAIEQVLLDPPGIGLPPEQIQITRLAAASSRRPSSSRFQAQTRPPTKSNVIAALEALAGPQVRPDDRVLIYYSGHGDEKLLPGSQVWREALVPHDGQKIEHLFDVEVNALIDAISGRTNDLTIILDCCHSGGATRDLEDVSPQGADRRLVGPPTAEETGEPAAPISARSSSRDSVGSGRILQRADPEYLVVVACQPDEKAGEGVYPGEQRAHGVLTYALLEVLRDRTAEERIRLRWADIWPDVLERVSARCVQLGRKPQFPWSIGRTERRMFGGAWEPQDAGYRVTRLQDGLYQIGAGTLMGVTPAAEVAVYGPEPAMFPELDSAEDQPVGRLRVLSAERAHSTAEAVGGAFDLPEGARGRLVQPGTSERLRVALKPEDPALADELGQSALLAIVPAETADADVEVIRLADGGWSIGNDVEPVLARVPAGESRALRAALEWYYRYHLVLQLAKRCSDPTLIGGLSVRLLDCADQAALDAMTPEQLADPPLPEVGRDEQRIYRRGPGDRSCVRIANSSAETLQVTLLNCSAGGLVEYMGDATLRGGGSQVLWSNQVVGRGFPASADRLPLPGQGGPAFPFVTDRLIAIGTTRRGVDLSHLTVDKTVQQVVDETLAQASRGMTEPDAERRSSTPVELWTATVAPVRITRM